MSGIFFEREDWRADVCSSVLDEWSSRDVHVSP